MTELKSTVLIIEDDKDILQVITYVLEEAGFIVIISSPDNYLVDIKSHKPNVILLDYWLEHTLGSDICISLKTDPCTKEIPVILTSAVNGISQVATQCKADDVLPKPFNIQDLEDKIHKWSVIND